MTGRDRFLIGIAIVLFLIGLGAGVTWLLIAVKTGQL